MWKKKLVCPFSSLKSLNLSKFSVVSGSPIYTESEKSQQFMTFFEDFLPLKKRFWRLQTTPLSPPYPLQLPNTKLFGKWKNENFFLLRERPKDYYFYSF